VERSFCGRQRGAAAGGPGGAAPVATGRLRRGGAGAARFAWQRSWGRPAAGTLDDGSSSSFEPRREDGWGDSVAVRTTLNMAERRPYASLALDFTAPAAAL